MHPSQIEHAIDLANQMVGRHNLVQIKGIKELALSILPPTHYATLPMMIDSVEWNHGSPCASMGLLQHNHLESRHWSVVRACASAFGGRAYESPPLIKFLRFSRHRSKAPAAAHAASQDRFANASRPSATPCA